MRRSMTVGLFILLMLGLAAPAWAQAAQATEAFVVLSGRADVPEGQTVGDLVVVHGSASTLGAAIVSSHVRFARSITPFPYLY